MRKGEDYYGKRKNHSEKPVRTSFKTSRNALADCLKCASDVTLVKGEKRVNPKSVLILMAAGIKCGDEITVECSGETEGQDLRTVVDAIESGLGEL